MAYEVPGFGLGAQVAAADLSALQYTAVIIDTAGKVAANTTSGGKIAGVLQNAPTAGQAAEVMCFGVTKWKAGAAIANAGPIMSDASGKCIAAATTGSTIQGYALETAGAADIVVSVLLIPGLGTF